MHISFFNCIEVKMTPRCIDVQVDMAEEDDEEDVVMEEDEDIEPWNEVLSKAIAGRYDVDAMNAYIYRCFNYGVNLPIKETELDMLFTYQPKFNSLLMKHGIFPSKPFIQKHEELMGDAIDTYSLVWLIRQGIPFTHDLFLKYINVEKFDFEDMIIECIRQYVPEVIDYLREHHVIKAKFDDPMSKVKHRENVIQIMESESFEYEESHDLHESMQRLLRLKFMSAKGITSMTHDLADEFLNFVEEFKDWKNPNMLFAIEQGYDPLYFFLQLFNN